MLLLFHRQQINSDIIFFTIQILFHSSPISFLFGLLFFFSPSRFSPIYKSSPPLSFLYVLLSPSLYSEQYSEPAEHCLFPDPKWDENRSIEMSPLKAPHLKDIQIWWQSTKACPCSKGDPLHNRNIFYSFEAVGCYYQRQWLLAFETFLLNGLSWNSSYTANSRRRAGFLLWGDFCEARLFQ